jgi:hypothetical protein
MFAIEDAAITGRKNKKGILQVYIFVPEKADPQSLWLLQARLAAGFQIHRPFL